MRLFIAIELPQNIKEALVAKETALKKCDLDLKWVAPQNLHLTMKFLGDTTEEKVSGIKEIIKNTAAGFNPFTVTLINFGFFPEEKRPRIFFVATDKEDTLKSIAADLEGNLEKAGFIKENRFKSHITLGRFKSAKNIDCLRSKIKNISLGENFNVKEISLIKSTLTNSCPIYEEIFSAKID